MDSYHTHPPPVFCAHNQHSTGGYVVKTPVRTGAGSGSWATGEAGLKHVLSLPKGLQLQGWGPGPRGSGRGEQGRGRGRAAPLLEPVAVLVAGGPGQDLAGLPGLGLRDDPLFFEQVHEPRRPRVADVEAPLQQGGGDA